MFAVFYRAGRHTFVGFGVCMMMSDLLLLGAHVCHNGNNSNHSKMHSYSGCSFLQSVKGKMRMRT